MPITTTLLYAAALALINLWLGLRTSKLRMGQRVLIGDGGDAALTARMRAQANFIEYVPMCLIMMALIESQRGPSRWLWLVGAVLVVARLLHPFGLDRMTTNALRIAGAGLTWLVTLVLVTWSLVIVAAPGLRF